MYAEHGALSMNKSDAQRIIMKAIKEGNIC